MLLNETVRRMMDEVDEKNEQMMAIERQRRSLQAEYEINAKRRELEQVERKIKEEQTSVREMSQHEELY